VKTYTQDELASILDLHKKWTKGIGGGKQADLQDVDLRGVNLQGVDLQGVDLQGANLQGANLRGAYMRGVNLRGVNLRGANLQGVDLRGAYMRGVNLQGVDLRNVNLRGANLRGVLGLDSAIMPGGYTFATYKREVVPALLMAGGRTLEEVVTASWHCHDWDNCPMAEAFGVHCLAEVPALYREQANLFVQLFDAKLIPNPIG
jgi:hypothetical protein